MPVDVKGLVEDIKVLIGVVAKAEGKAVLHTIELAGRYVQLRGSVRNGRWLKVLEGLKVSPRVASRYLAIGDTWWVQDQPPGADLLAQLPSDLCKLEQLAKLSPEELPKFLSVVPCKTCGRGKVIKLVESWIGEKPSASADQKVTVKDLKKRWADYVRRMVNAIGSLDDQAADDEIRGQLLADLEAKFSEVEEALTEPDPVREEPGEEVEPPFTEEEEAEEEAQDLDDEYEDDGDPEYGELQAS